MLSPKHEEIQVDTHVSGIEPSAPVTVLYLKKAGDAVDVTYELLSGQVLKKTVFRTDEPKLAVASQTRVWPFDAQPEAFKLAAEATRIKLAYLFDPMMAVHTSDVEPLPHQISAVYEAMLPRQPLRFVLADDPGTGKTIMAGFSSANSPSGAISTDADGVLGEVRAAAIETNRARELRRLDGPPSL